MTKLTNRLTAAAVLLFISVVGAATLVNIAISGDKDNIAVAPEISGSGCGGSHKRRRNE